MTDKSPYLTDQTIGPYTIKDTLGHNNASAVYRAIHTATGREVALRVLLPAQSKDYAERFMEEIRRVAGLRHPYLVPFVDYGAADDIVYIAMPRLLGGTLQERLLKRHVQQGLARNEPLDINGLPSLGEIAAMVERIAAGLDYAHARGIIHQQVQPGNILFDREGRAYLGDTGLTKLFKVIFSLKETNSVTTHAFSSPEQWQGERMTAASDQYSLGAVVYLLVTGRQVFESSSIFKMMELHMNELLTPPHHVRSGLPGDLTPVLLKALAKSPEDRYDSVTTFAQDFAHSIQGLEGRPTDFFTFPLREVAARKHDIYVGYSETEMESAHKLVNDLSDEGVSVWQDQALKPGTIAWKAALGDAVRAAGVVVILLTPSAMRSEWINVSLSLAQKYRKPVIGLTLRGAEGHRAAFNRVIDASGGYEAGIKALAGAVRAHLT